MNYTNFLELHKTCVAAMRTYFCEAETTTRLLAKCTAEPLSLGERSGLLSQEIVENNAQLIYLDSKRLLHRAALLGYGFPNGTSPVRISQIPSSN
jgi:hypothetical protein